MLPPSPRIPVLPVSVLSGPVDKRRLGSVSALEKQVFFAALHVLRAVLASSPPPDTRQTRLHHTGARCGRSRPLHFTPRLTPSASRDPPASQEPPYSARLPPPSPPSPNVLLFRSPWCQRASPGLLSPPSKETRRWRRRGTSTPRGPQTRWSSNTSSR